MELRTAVQIRADVEYNCGFSSGSDNATKIDRCIARAYEDEIPQLIQGSAKKRKLSFSITAGVDEYDLDAKAAAAAVPFTFYGIRSPLILLDDLPIWYETDPEKFWQGYRHSDTTQARPGGVLHDRRYLTFRQVPDTTYTVVLWCGGSRDPMPGGGITLLEANVVADLATFARAKELGMSATMDRYAKALEVDLKLLAGKYKASVPAREPLQYPGF